MTQVEEYYIGQIFIGEYPPEAANWVNNNNCYIDEIEPLENNRRFEIFEVQPPTEEEINNLTMTALDFINVLEGFGLTLQQIDAYLKSNLSVYTQLTYCNSVYCGVAKALMPITYEDITITAKMVEKAFKDKYGVK